MKADEEKVDLFMFVIIASVAVLAFISSVSFFFAEGKDNILGNKGAVTDFSAGWKSSDGIVLSINGMIDSKKGLSADVPVRITKSIEKVNDGDMLYIHSRNLVINIYANGEPMYITGENGLSAGISGFDNYILTTVPSGNDKIELMMEIYFTEYSEQCGIGSILLGSDSKLIRRLLSENILPVISGVVFLVLGIALIIFGVSTRKKIENYMSSVYFGIFLVMFALGSTFDTSWSHIVLNNTPHAEYGQRIFLSAALPAFLAFIDKFFITEHTYPVKIMCILSVIAFPTVMIMQAAGVVTLISVGTYYLIFMAVCGLVAFEEIFVFMIKTRGTRALRKMRDYVSVYVYIAACLMDILVFISMPVGNDDLFFSRLGLFVMSAVTLISWFGDILDMIKLGVQAGRIGKIAFTDANTGIGNVAAFKSEFEELESKKYMHKYIAVVQFDVNNLKVINDSRGHEAGDMLIKSAADIINKSFGAVGNCYRTGGDEFVALVVNDHAPIECEEAIYRFNKLIDKFNDDPERPFDLRIAYGVAYFQNDKTANKTLKEIHKIADERMYENKKMLKARYARTAEEAIIR